MSQEDDTQTPVGEMGADRDLYATLEGQADQGETIESAKDFYASQAEVAEAAGAGDLALLIKRHAEGEPTNIWQPDGQTTEGSWKRPATEAQARLEIDGVVQIAAKFLEGNQSQDERSSTLDDLNLGNRFDQAVATEIMRLFGATGRLLGRPVQEDDGRFETTAYATNLRGIELRRWRHHPSGTMTGGDSDFEKFYLAKV